MRKFESSPTLKARDSLHVAPVEKSTSRNNTMLHIGDAAIAEELRAPNYDERDKPAELNKDEVELLFLAAEGATVEEAASLLSNDKETIESLRDSVINKLGGPNMAAAVNRAIKLGVIPIEVNNSRSIIPLDREITILKIFARGGTNSEIAQELGVTKSQTRNYTRWLFQKLGSKGRVNSLTCAYRLGILELPSQSEPTE